MRKQQLLEILLRAIPTYATLQEPLTERTPAIEELFKAAGDGWRKEKCPNRTPPYCGNGTIYRKTIFRELREPVTIKDPSIIDQLMYGKEEAHGPWAHTYDLDLCGCRKCNAVWLETHFTTHTGTKPGDHLPMPWEEMGFEIS
ncbi:Uncharacterised protein [uncultured archaeon]|nr:Uncharacterised protein [uncultured archaeon]